MPNRDDVHHTMVNDCPQLLIPLVNEVFKEHYTGEEKGVLGHIASKHEKVKEGVGKKPDEINGDGSG